MPHADRPRFPGPLLRRTRCTDTSSKATLWVKAQHEGALTVQREDCVFQVQQPVPAQRLAPTERILLGAPWGSSGTWAKRHV